ncbi:hypothetical protein K8R66_00470, partial [bacterium]|nr:hypothetical protein [bacterium]
MEWTKLTKKGKNLPILIVDAVANGFIKYFTDFHDGRIVIANYRQILSSRFISKSDFLKYSKMYQDNEINIEKWANDWIKEFEQFKKYVEEINKLDLKNKTNLQLKKIFGKYSDHYVRVCSYAYDYHFVGSFYPDKIIAIFKDRGLNSKEINKLMGLILTLKKPIFMNKEEFSLLKLVIKIKREKLNNNLINKQLKQHRQKYGFLGMYLHEGELTSIKTYKERANKLLRKSLKVLSKD